MQLSLGLMTSADSDAGAGANAPPRTEGGDGGASPLYSSAGSDELVALPAIVQQQLRRSLLFGTNGGVPLRLFASSATAAGLAAGYLANLLYNALPQDGQPLPLVWTLLRWETIVFMGLIGLLVTECAMNLATTMSQRGVEGTDSAAFLQALLGYSVPPAVEAKVAWRRKMSLLTTVVPVGSCFLVPLHAWLSGAVAPADEVLAAYGVLIVCFLPVVSIGAGWQLFLQVPVIVVCDRISRSAAGIRASSVSLRPVNFDAIMRSVVAAHDLQQRCATTRRSTPTLHLPATHARAIIRALSLVDRQPCSFLLIGWWRCACGPCGLVGRRLSALLAPLLHTFILLAVILAWHRSLMTLAPREGIEAALLNPRWVYACGVELVLIGCVWLLSVVAATSTACDELVAAISGLRCRMQRLPQDGGDIEAGESRLRSSGGIGGSLGLPEGAGGWQAAGPGSPCSALVPVLASDHDLARIDGVLDFTAALNHGQGLGFLFLGRRIGVAMLWARLFQGSFVIFASFALAFNFVD